MIIFFQKIAEIQTETESIMKSEDEGNEQFTYLKNRIVLEF